MTSMYAEYDLVFRSSHGCSWSPVLVKLPKVASSCATRKYGRDHVAAPFSSFASFRLPCPQPAETCRTLLNTTPLHMGIHNPHRLLPARRARHMLAWILERCALSCGRRRPLATKKVCRPLYITSHVH
jgi:hypothetical protein